MRDGKHPRHLEERPQGRSVSMKGTIPTANLLSSHATGRDVACYRPQSESESRRDWPPSWECRERWLDAPFLATTIPSRIRPGAFGGGVSKSDQPNWFSCSKLKFIHPPPEVLHGPTDSLNVFRLVEPATDAGRVGKREVADMIADREGADHGGQGRDRTE